MLVRDRWRGISGAAKEREGDVLLWRGCLDLEGYRVGGRVVQTEDLGHFMGEGACAWSATIAGESASHAIDIYA